MALVRPRTRPVGFRDTGTTRVRLGAASHHTRTAARYAAYPYESAFMRRTRRTRCVGTHTIVVIVLVVLDPVRACDGGAPPCTTRTSSEATWKLPQ